MAVKELGELLRDHGVRSGPSERPEPGVVRASALDESVLARGFELRKESLLLDAEVRLELPGEATPQVVPRLQERASLGTFVRGEPDAPSQHERPVMVVGERLQVRVTLHSSAFPAVDARACQIAVQAATTRNP